MLNSALSKKIQSLQELESVIEFAGQELSSPLTEKNWCARREFLRTTRNVNGRQSLAAFDFALIPLFKGWRDHTPWLSPYINREGKLFVTPSPAYGEQDRQQACSRPGKYLALFPNLTQEEVKSRATAINNILKPTTLSFAHSSTEIVDIYLNGPSSCMSRPTSEYGTNGTHPVSVYGYDNDIAVAYIRRGERIIARTVVNTRRKQWVEIYGHDSALKSLLKTSGYTQNNYALEGCKLSLVKLDDGGFVLPYLDGTVDTVCMKSDHLIINDDGAYEATTTCGSSNVMIICEECQQHVGEDDAYHIDDTSGNVCYDCLSSKYIRINDDYFHRDECSCTEDTEEYFVTDDPGDIIEIDDLFYGDTDSYEYCEIDECHYLMDDLVRVDDGTYVNIDHVNPSHKMGGEGNTLTVCLDGCEDEDSRYQLISKLLHRDLDFGVLTPRINELRIELNITPPYRVLFSYSSGMIHQSEFSSWSRRINLDIFNYAVDCR